MFSLLLVVVSSCAIGMASTDTDCSVDSLMREFRRVLSKSRLLAAKLDLLTRDLANQTEGYQQDLTMSLRQAVGAAEAFHFDRINLIHIL